MNSNLRLVVNTLAQGLRTLFNIFLSLYSTRLVMDALGKYDFGLYMLIASVISLFPYLINAMVTTTQRHLSYSYGQGDEEASQRIFANSYLLHLAVGVVFCLIAASFTNIIFERQWLVVEPYQLAEAHWIYLLTIASALLTFLTSPFRALCIAHENIVYLSVVDVMDGVLKLGLVFLLYQVDNYRVTLYAVIMTTVLLFHFLAVAIYSWVAYKESSVLPRLSLYDGKLMRQLAGFASWTIFGMGCVYVRSQGAAVALNQFFGTVINSAYGVGTQVFNNVQNFTQSINNAIAPQVIAAEGQGNRQRMLFLSSLTSKYGFLVSALISLPLIFEMPGVLSIWLKEVPEHSVLFCRVLLLTSTCDQLTQGLAIANQAIGRLRNYTLLIYIPKLLTLPVIVFGLMCGWELWITMSAFVLFEAISMLLRIPYLKHVAHLDVRVYFRAVFARVAGPFLIMSLTGMCCIEGLPSHPFRFVLTGALCVASGLISIWIMSLDNRERTFALQQLRKFIRK